MMCSECCKLRILYLCRLGYCPAAITCILQAERLNVSSRGLTKFLKRFKETGCIFLLKEVLIFLLGAIGQVVGSGRRSVITDKGEDIVEQQMCCNDGTTTSQLHIILTGMGYSISHWGGPFKGVLTASSHVT